MKLYSTAWNQVKKLEEERNRLLKTRNELWQELYPKRETGTPKYAKMHFLTKAIQDINSEIRFMRYFSL